MTQAVGWESGVGTGPRPLLYRLCPRWRVASLFPYFLSNHSCWVRWPASSGTLLYLTCRHFPLIDAAWPWSFPRHYCWAVLWMWHLDLKWFGRDIMLDANVLSLLDSIRLWLRQRLQGSDSCWSSDPCLLSCSIYYCLMWPFYSIARPD